jgi:hypothetical protein
MEANQIDPSEMNTNPQVCKNLFWLGFSMMIMVCQCLLHVSMHVSILSGSLLGDPVLQWPPTACAVMWMTHVVTYGFWDDWRGIRVERVGISSSWRRQTIDACYSRGDNSLLCHRRIAGLASSVFLKIYCWEKLEIYCASSQNNLWYDGWLMCCGFTNIHAGGRVCI